MIDVVIPLGNGSQWQNNELRYALRSIQRFLRNYRKVYIIGHRPAWLTDQVIHIPFEDKRGHERNIMEKVLHACKYPQLSDKFLFMNDDHYLVSYFDAPKFPNYYFNSIEFKLTNCRGGYAETVRNTLFSLKARKLPHSFYDVHTPIIYDKALFPQVMGQYDWSKRNGYLIKSLYCNTLRLHGIMMQDCKANKPMSCFHIEKWLEDRPMFSSAEKITPEIATYLEYLFPDKSKYEV